MVFFTSVRLDRTASAWVSRRARAARLLKVHVFTRPMCERAFAVTHEVSHNGLGFACAAMMIRRGLRYSTRSIGESSVE